MEIIQRADWIIDSEEGEIVATGTPEQVVKEKRSYTGAHLKPLLELSVVCPFFSRPIGPLACRLMSFSIRRAG